MVETVKMMLLRLGGEARLSLCFYARSLNVPFCLCLIFVNFYYFATSLMEIFSRFCLCLSTPFIMKICCS